MVEKMPVLFIGHGSPMNALEDNDYTKSLGILGKNIGTPKAILVISAHWETDGSWVTSMEKPRTIHDFFGFPKELAEFEYPAPGDPELASKIVAAVDSSNVHLDSGRWGLDHGAWSILTHMYPDASVPIVQLSIDRSLTLAQHYELGKQLRFLREQGVLIMGSGNVVHNLGHVDWNAGDRPFDWAKSFDTWVKEKIVARDFKSLYEHPLTTKDARLSVPTLDHYIPILYILGASDEGDQLSFVYEGFQIGSMSMTSFRFD